MTAPTQSPPREPTPQGEIASAINRFSLENDSNTPDFILADFLMGCLHVFGRAVREREDWYKRDAAPAAPADDADTFTNVREYARAAVFGKDAAPAPDALQRWGNAYTDEVGRKGAWLQREDGYWTPWHIANDLIAAKAREIAARDTHLESFRIGIRERDATIQRLQKSHTKAWNISVRDTDRAERAEAALAAAQRRMAESDAIIAEFRSGERKTDMEARRDEALADLAAARADADKLRAALVELIACKDLKDLTWRMKRDGKPQEKIDAHSREYAERKYKAWDAARAATKGTT